MTDSTTELDDLRAQLERVTAKKDELLHEVKQKGAQVQKLTEITTAQGARLRRYEVEGPIERAIAEVAVPAAVDAFTALLGQHYRFEADDDGQPVIRDPQGQPVRLPAIPGKKGREIEREARATAEDIRALVDLPELRSKFAAITVASRASGGGAGGSSVGSAPRQAPKPAAEPRPEPKLGLR